MERTLEDEALCSSLLWTGTLKPKVSRWLCQGHGEGFRLTLTHSVPCLSPLGWLSQDPYLTRSPGTVRFQLWQRHGDVAGAGGYRAQPGRTSRFPTTRSARWGSRDLGGSGTLVGQARCPGSPLSGPPALASPKNGCVLTLHLRHLAFLTSLGPRWGPRAHAAASVPTLPSCGCSAELPIGGQSFRTCTGSPSLFSFHKGQENWLLPSAERK